MKSAITVAIVTRNRAQHLEECLSSLSHQSVKIQHILIVNNNSTDNTREVIKKYLRVFSIAEIFEKKTGYPHVYNRALKSVKTQWIVFIDDDCVADTHWFQEVIQTIQIYWGYAAIVGVSLNYYKTNPFACAFQFSNDWWRLRSINERQIVDYAVLDSRNIVYNVSILNKYHIQFDPSLIHGGEDSDVGMQIKQNHLNAAFVPQIIVYHKEPKTRKDYFAKKQMYKLSAHDLSLKWRNNYLSDKTSHKYRSLLNALVKQMRHLSFKNSILYLFIVSFDIVYSKIIKQ